MYECLSVGISVQCVYAVPLEAGKGYQIPWNGGFIDGCELLCMITVEDIFMDLSKTKKSTMNLKL